MNYLWGYVAGAGLGGRLQPITRQPSSSRPCFSSGRTLTRSRGIRALPTPSSQRSRRRGRAKSRLAPRIHRPPAKGRPSPAIIYSAEVPDEQLGPDDWDLAIGLGGRVLNIDDLFPS